MNEDGFTDLVAHNQYSDGLTVLFGTGNGTFEERRVHPSIPAARKALVGEYSGDSHVDLAILTQGSISVFPGDGTGDFGPPSAVAGSGHFDMTEGDFNGDGFNDLAGLDNFPNLVHVSLGDGSGGFSSLPPFPLQGNDTYKVIQARDLDGDGCSDLIVSSLGDFEVFHGDPNGIFRPTPIVATTGVIPGLTSGDFDEDGVLDIITSLPNENRVLFHAGNAGRHDRIPVVVPSYNSFASTLPAIDLNKDGHLDLLTHDAQLHIYFGHGTGTFDPPRDHTLGERTRDVQAMRTGDFDGDGQIDFAYIDTDYNTPSREIRTLLAHEDLSLVQGPETPVNRQLDSIEEEFALSGDLDGDGIDDLVLALPGEDGILTLLGTSTAQFSPLPVTPLPFSRAGK